MNELIDDIGLVYPVKKQATPPRPARKLPELIDDMGLLQQPTQQSEAPIPQKESLVKSTAKGFAKGLGTFMPEAFWGGLKTAKDVADKYPAFTPWAAGTQLLPEGFLEKQLGEVEKTKEYLTPEERTGWTRHIPKASETLGQMTGSMVSGAGVGTLPLMAGGAGVNKMVETRKEGYSLPRSIGAGVGSGVGEYFTEKIPIKYLSQIGLPYLKRLAGGLISDIPGEIYSTFLDMKAVDEGLLGKKYSPKEYARAILDTAATAGIVTGVATTATQRMNRGETQQQRQPPPGAEALDKEGFSYENAELNKIWDAEYKATQQAQPKINEPGKQEVILPEGDTAGHEKPELIDDLGILNTQVQPEQEARRLPQKNLAFMPKEDTGYVPQLDKVTPEVTKPELVDDIGILDTAQQPVDQSQQTHVMPSGEVMQGATHSQQQPQILHDEQPVAKAEVAPILQQAAKGVDVKTLKQQKAYLLREIDAAIINIKKNPDTEVSSVEIEVPGDGTFRVANHHSALMEFKKRAAKGYPTTVKHTSPTGLQTKTATFPMPSPGGYKNLGWYKGVTPEGMPYHTDMNVMLFSAPDPKIIKPKVWQEETELGGKGMGVTAAEMLATATGSPAENIEFILNPGNEEYTGTSDAPIRASKDDVVVVKLTNQEGGNVFIDQKNYLYAKKYFPDATFEAKDNDSPAIIVSNGKRVGLVMGMDMPEIDGNEQTKEPGGVYEAEADAFTSQQIQTGEGKDISGRQMGTQEEIGVPGSQGITYKDVWKESADRPIWVVYKKDGEEIGRVKTTTANTKEYKQKMGEIGATEITLEEVAFPDSGLQPLPEATLRMMPTIGKPYTEEQERLVNVAEEANPYDSQIDEALIADRINPKIPKKELIRYGKERGITITNSTKTADAHLKLRRHLIDNPKGYDILAGDKPKITDAEYLQRAKERSKNQKPLEYRHAGIPIPDIFRQVAKSVIGKKWRNFWNIFSTLSKKEKFLDLRNDTIGRLWYDSQKIDKLAGRLKAMPIQSREDMMAVIRGKENNSILDKEQQELAKYVREQADAIGLAAVKRGMMTQETYDANKGTYMHTMYFRHLLDEIDAGSSGSTKMGRQNYLKGRMDPVIKEVKNADGSIGYKIYTKGGKPYPKNPYWDELAGKPKWQAEQYATMEEAEAAKVKIEKKVALRRKELGEVKDIAVVAPTYFADALGDITMYDLFKSIAIEPDWAWKKSSTTIDGKTYSIGMLQDEIEMQRQTFGVTQSPESLQRLKRLEAKYQKLQKAAASATETGEIDKREWHQMPISKRYGALSGVYVRLEIARDILAVFDVAEPELSSMYSNMKKVFPAAMTAFKIGKVAVNIPSFPRNFISGGIQVNLSGTPLYKIPGLMVKAVQALYSKNKYYWDAGKKGIFRTSMSDIEINDMRNIMEQWKPARNNLYAIVNIAKDLSKYYGKIDGFWKLVKFIEQVDNGGNIDTAAREAQKWGMDYSIAHPSVKWARRWAIPFGSFQYKIAPLLVESLYKRPWVIAKYMAIPYILTEIAKQTLRMTGDEWEELKKAYPSWIRRSLTTFPLPWRDGQGNIQIIDIGAFFPWQAWQGIMLGLYRAGGGDREGLEEAIHQVGLGNPVLDMFELSRRLSGDRPPADAYTGQEVFNSNDSATMQAIKFSLYVTNKFTPTFLNEEYGFLGKMYEATAGKDVYGNKDRYGRKVTYPQAALRLVGVNVNPVTKAQGMAEKKAKTAQIDTDLAKMRRDGIGGKRFDNAVKKATKRKKEVLNPTKSGNPIKDLYEHAKGVYNY